MQWQIRLCALAINQAGTLHLGNSIPDHGTRFWQPRKDVQGVSFQSEGQANLTGRSGPKDMQAMHIVDRASVTAAGCVVALSAHDFEDYSWRTFHSSEADRAPAATTPWLLRTSISSSSCISSALISRGSTPLPLPPASTSVQCH